MNKEVKIEGFECILLGIDIYSHPPEYQFYKENEKHFSLIGSTRYEDATKFTFSDAVEKKAQLEEDEVSSYLDWRIVIHKINE